MKRFQQHRSSVAARLLAAFLLISPGYAGAEEAVGAPGAGSSMPGSASPDQLRAFGYGLLRAGDLDGARKVADALIKSDPGDTAALMLRSQVAALTGNEKRSRIDAREVWRLSDQPGPRFGAAMMVAHSLAADGYYQRGQFWLRRASQDAQDERQRSMVASAFDQMRSRSPLKWSVGFSIRPSDNVNDGSSAASVTYPGLPEWSIPPVDVPLSPAQQALSGTEANVAASLTWRLPPTATTMTAFHLRLDQTMVRLSSEAKEVAPELRGSDFDRATIEIGATRRWRPEGNKAIWTFGLFAGHDWSGGEHLSNSLSLSTQAERQIGAATVGFAALTLADQHRLDAEIRSTRVKGLSFGLQHQLAGRDMLTAVVSLRDVASDSPGNRNSATGLRLGWRKAEPVAGLGLEASLGYEARDYPDSPFRPDGGRQDRRANLDLTIEFREIDYMGFSPTLDLSASRVEANVGLYESRRFGVQLGFRTAF